MSAQQEQSASKLVVIAAVLSVIYLLVLTWYPYSPFQVPVLSGPSEVMKIIISLAALCASLFVILSRGYDSKDRHWAYGTVGTLLGFWLKP